MLNRYRRGLEIRPQAKTSKSGHANSFSFFFRRFRATSMTQRRVENIPVHFWTFSPVSVKDLLTDRVITILNFNSESQILQTTIDRGSKATHEQTAQKNKCQTRLTTASNKP